VYILNTNKKIISSNTNNLFFNIKKFFIPVLCPRRGVSEVISTILLLGITVAGAAMASIYIQDSNIADVSSMMPSIGSAGSTVSSIKLISYDTRDTPGEDLARIPGLQNFNNGKLCTVSCAGNPNVQPTSATDGTEFIVFTIRNIGLDLVTLRGLTINDESFSWDSVNAGSCLNLPVGLFPAPGTFAIVRAESPPATCDPLWKQLSSNILLPGAEATLVVKLSSTLGNGNDLALNSPLRIKMDTEKVDLETFLIIVGLVK